MSDVKPPIGSSAAFKGSRLVRLAGAVGVLLLAVAFQNCGSFSQGSGSSQSKSFKFEGSSTGDSHTASGSGNGEGYGGKLEGRFSAIDTLNVCGKATTSKFVVRDQIEFRSGQAYRTIDNCRTLPAPLPISSPSFKYSSNDGQVFVTGDYLYQQDQWQDGSVPNNEFVDTFCRGVDETQPSPMKSDEVELSIFQGKKTLNLSTASSNNGGSTITQTQNGTTTTLSGTGTMTVGDYARRGLLHLLTRDLQTGAISNDKQLVYDNLKEHVEIATGTMLAHSIQSEVNMTNYTQPMFTMMFITGSEYLPYDPSQLTYVEFSTFKVHTVRSMTCWMSH